MKHTYRMIALLLCLSLTLSACGGCGKKEIVEEEAPDSNMNDTVSGQLLTGGKAADDVFSLAVDFDKSLNPLRTTSSASLLISGLVYDNVFEVDANYNLSSRVVTDWVCNEEGNFWTLTVDTSIPMHDGSTLTAYDVAYSIQRAMIYSKHFGSRLCSVQGCTAYAPDQLCISTLYPDTRLPYRLTIPVIKQGSILSVAPAGSGPYCFGYSEAEEAEPTPTPESAGDAEPTPSPSPDGGEERIPDLLRAFSQYGGEGTLPIDTIYLREYTDPASMITEYESSLVDLVVNDPTGVYNMGYGGMNERRVFPTTNMHYIGFNGYSNFLCYAAYRHALNYVIDRAGICRDIMDGWADPATLPINPACDLYDTEMAATLDYDLEQCRAELEALGCRDLDGDGQLEFALSGSKVEIDLKFIVCSDTAAKVTAARRICEAMQEVGFPVTLQELPWKEYQDRLANPTDEDTNKATFDMYYDEVALTADWDMMPFFTEEGALNYGKWKVDDVLNAIQGYMSADPTDGVKQKEQCLNMCRVLSEQALVLPVCFERRVAISHLGVIRGMRASQYNLFTNMTDWTIQLG